VNLDPVGAKLLIVRPEDKGQYPFPEVPEDHLRQFDDSYGQCSPYKDKEQDKDKEQKNIVLPDRSIPISRDQRDDPCYGIDDQKVAQSGKESKHNILYQPSPAHLG